MKKYTPSAKLSDNKDKWYIVDADGLVLGRMASVIAACLRGKNNPLYTPHVDTGDSVVVINAEKVNLTGKKWEKKTYYRHSGYMGGIKSITAEKLRDKNPEDIIRMAVKGMLPKNRLGTQLFKKLKVYKGDKHPHGAQKPEVLEI